MKIYVSYMRKEGLDDDRAQSEKGHQSVHGGRSCHIKKLYLPILPRF